MATKQFKEMSFLGHLEELRWLLVRSSAAVVTMAVVSYFFADYIFTELIFNFDCLKISGTISHFFFVCWQSHWAHCIN